MTEGPCCLGDQCYTCQESECSEIAIERAEAKITEAGT